MAFRVKFAFQSSAVIVDREMIVIILARNFSYINRPI